MLYACKGHRQMLPARMRTSSLAGRDREREKKKREKEREREREREKEKEKERVFILKRMTSTLAPFSYIVLL